MHGTLKSVAILGAIFSLLGADHAVPAGSSTRAVEPNALAAAISATSAGSGAR